MHDRLPIKRIANSTVLIHVAAVDNLEASARVPALSFVFCTVAMIAVQDTAVAGIQVILPHKAQLASIQQSISKRALEDAHNGRRQNRRCPKSENLNGR